MSNVVLVFKKKAALYICTISEHLRFRFFKLFREHFLFHMNKQTNSSFPSAKEAEL